MNTLIKKVDGGIAKDDFGKLQLKIPAGVLAADTTVTIVTSVLAHVVTAPYVLIAAWRIDTNVALASLATLPGTLCYMVPTTIPEGKLRFYVDNQTPAASPLGTRAKVPRARRSRRSPRKLRCVSATVRARRRRRSPTSTRRSANTRRGSRRRCCRSISATRPRSRTSLASTGTVPV